MKTNPLLVHLQNTFPDIPKKELLARILCGEVLVDHGCIRDPKYPVTLNNIVDFRENRRYVSRGGEKLEHALKQFGLNLVGKICIDAGSSTGGFTDCLIKHGASRVYSVDVGYSQLDFSLRNNHKVTVLERTNIMDCKVGMFPENPDIGVMDLSFRSVRGAGRHLLSLVLDNMVVALIKPQFEWQLPDENFNGIINDETILCGILLQLVEDFYKEKTYITDVIESPIRGRKGNREFFFLLTKTERKSLDEVKNMTVEVV